MEHGSKKSPECVFSSSLLCFRDDDTSEFLTRFKEPETRVELMHYVYLLYLTVGTVSLSVYTESRLVPSSPFWLWLTFLGGCLPHPSLLRA